MLGEFYTIFGAPGQAAGCGSSISASSSQSERGCTVALALCAYVEALVNPRMDRHAGCGRAGQKFGFLNDVVDRVSQNYLAQLGAEPDKVVAFGSHVDVAGSD